MAFIQNMTLDLILIDQIMNLLFFIDIILTFFAAYVDQDFNIVDDHHVFFTFINLFIDSCYEISIRMVFNRFNFGVTFRSSTSTYYF